jgi:hypothetical protein
VMRSMAASGPIYTEQAQVHDWPAHIALSALVLAVVLLAVWGMRRSWRRRAAAQAVIAEPAPVPAEFAADLLVGVDGRYLGSTTAGDWLDRVVAHGLGAPSRVTVRVGGAGLVLEREGAPSFLVPRADLVAVRLDRAIAGEVYEPRGIVVVTWNCGETLLDTGFRSDTPAGNDLLVGVLTGAGVPAVPLADRSTS